MALSKSDRLRIVMDLLIDGDVTDEALYTALDKSPPTLTQKYAEAFWHHFNYDSAEPEEPTVNQLATVMINEIRRIIRDVYLSNASDNAMSQVSAAREAARSEAISEIGSDER